VTCRGLHTAVRLPDGRVLVAGGFNRASEVYVAASGTFQRVGDLSRDRRYHTMTLLADGRVLVAGGAGGASDATAEVFDPRTNTWSPTGRMAVPRKEHSAVRLRDGRVLVAGGAGAGGAAELYDTATGAWTRTSPMRVARSQYAAGLLADGRVLVVGGQDASGRLLASAEVYDPATGTWTPTGTLGLARRYHTLTTLTDGRVLVVGGAGTQGRSISAELYEPATGTWTPTGSLAQPRSYHTATLLTSGRVLVTGGYDGWTGILTTAELYDPSTGTWEPTASMGEERYRHVAVLLADGQVLVAGGFSNGDQASAELYNPSDLFEDNDGDGVTSNLDCDDNDSTVYPGAPEVCEGVDNDCDTEVDEGCGCTSDQGVSTRAGFKVVQVLGGLEGGAGGLTDVEVARGDYWREPGEGVLFTVGGGIGVMDAHGGGRRWLVRPGTTAFPATAYLEYGYDGLLYACDTVGGNNVWRVLPDGTVEFVAAHPHCEGIAYGDIGDGTQALYLSSWTASLIKRMAPDGTIRTLATGFPSSITDLAIPRPTSRFAPGLYAVQQSSPGIYHITAGGTVRLAYRYGGNFTGGEEGSFSPPDSRFGDAMYHLSGTSQVQRLLPDGTAEVVAWGGGLSFGYYTMGGVFSTNGRYYYFTNEGGSIWRLQACDSR
jgi:hypothetical protein